MASSIGRRHPRRVTEAAAVPTGTSWHSAAQQSFDAVLSSGEPLQGGTRAAIIPTARPPPPPPQGLESGLAAAATLTRESYQVATGGQTSRWHWIWMEQAASPSWTERREAALPKLLRSLYSVEMGDRMLLQAVDVGSGWGPSEHPILRPS